MFQVVCHAADAAKGGGGGGGLLNPSFRGARADDDRRRRRWAVKIAAAWGFLRRFRNAAMQWPLHYSAPWASVMGEVEIVSCPRAPLEIINNPQ